MGEEAEGEHEVRSYDFMLSSMVIMHFMVFSAVRIHLTPVGFVSQKRSIVRSRFPKPKRSGGGDFGNLKVILFLDKSSHTV